MKILKSLEDDLEIPQIDLLTLLFGLSLSSIRSPLTLLTADCRKIPNGATQKKTQFFTSKLPIL